MTTTHPKNPTTHPKNPTTNPSSVIRTRFAVRFLHAMKKLNKKTPPSRRYHTIRAAACASMASAVGPRRAWSRAILRKIRARTLHDHLIHKSRNHRLITRRKSAGLRGNPRDQEEVGFRQEDDLRGLVPGGEGMGFCRLLSETAHYIKCLRAQVQVMTNILDHYSSS
ncbi:transcription factor IBH1-like [Sesamum indicum]|uniref:Transcription factor IBH1-like n=1 Tax=Sesamum indicum TaxID=4182 RepID=A0A6I9T8I4_SESIN|nr:transcription factor IBH1-like [Sesamum indicum]